MVTIGRGLWPRFDRRGPSSTLCLVLAAGVVSAALACSRTPAKSVHPRSELTIGVALPRGNDMLGLSALSNGFQTETLIGLAQNGRPEPRLARAWTRSPDGLTWSFSISPEIYFHDGTRLTAGRLAQLLRDATTDPSNRAIPMRPNFSDITSITAPDELTVEVRTRVPRALLLDQLADLTLPRAGTAGALGAFAVDPTTGGNVSLHAFDKYYRGKPAVTKVTLRSYRSLRAAWAAMMRGETDAIYEVSRDATEFVEAESGVRVYPLLRPFVNALVFNVERPQLRSPSVRQALTGLIDRDAIMHTALRGHGQTADGPLWPSHWILSAPSTSGSFDPRSAEEALAELPIRSEPGQMPARLRFTCLIPADMPQFERTGLMVQQQLYQHGVDMQLVAVPIGELVQRMGSGNFDAALFEFLGRTPNWVYTFWHSPLPGAPVLMHTGYRAADAALDHLLGSGSDDEVRAAVAEVRRVMSDDPPAIFIAWPEVGRAITRDFESPIERGQDVLSASSLWMLRPAGASR